MAPAREQQRRVGQGDRRDLQPGDRQRRLATDRVASLAFAFASTASAARARASPRRPRAASRVDAPSSARLPIEAHPPGELAPRLLAVTLSWPGAVATSDREKSETIVGGLAAVGTQAPRRGQGEDEVALAPV